jgi:hypothetical protein
MELPLGKNRRMALQSSSTLTASNRRSVPSSLRARSSSDGTSSTHGGHQVAQKFSSTGWPRCALSDTLRPPASGN